MSILVFVEQGQKNAQYVERVLFCLISSFIKSTVLEPKIICFRDLKRVASKKKKKHIKPNRKKRQGDAEKSSYSNRRETKSKLSWRSCTSLRNERQNLQQKLRKLLRREMMSWWRNCRWSRMNSWLKNFKNNFLPKTNPKRILTISWRNRSLRMGLITTMTTTSTKTKMSTITTKTITISSNETKKKYRRLIKSMPKSTTLPLK